MRQQQLRVHIFLLLDALDEYEGDNEAIADLVLHLTVPEPTSFTTIQVLFSSRPWLVFQQCLGHLPGIRIHDHTRADIRSLVERSFQSARMFPSLNTMTVDQARGYENIISSLVAKANGVFLWVRLSVRKLLQAAAEGESIEKLQNMINLLPIDLDNFYSELIERLPKDKHTRKQGFYMLSILLCSLEVPSMSSFRDMLQCADCQNLEDCRRRIETTPFDRTQRTTWRYNFIKEVREMTGGLVESQGGAAIYFMHQTVKDFVNKPDFARLMLREAASEPRDNAFSILAKYEMYLSVSSQHLHHPEILHYFQSAERTTGKAQTVFLDSVTDSQIRQMSLHKRDRQY